MTTKQTTAPWTQEQVESLNDFQTSGAFHPFTCGQCRDTLGTGSWPEPINERLLVATQAGWTCPTCDYTQNWAWAFMADREWERIATASAMQDKIRDQEKLLRDIAQQNKGRVVSSDPSGEDKFAIPGDPSFIDACRVVVANGFTPVRSVPYQRLRAWLDEVGWPPRDFDPAMQRQRQVCNGCNRAVNLALSGGVLDDEGQPYHKACLQRKEGQ